MEHFIIYKTVNIINNKIYVGQHHTNNINDGYIGSGLILLKAIEKYGKHNFTKEILEECNSFDEMNDKEIEWIRYYNSFMPIGYNIREGGKNSPMSESTKKILSDSRKGKYKLGESNPNYKAKSFTKEIIQKISNSVKEKYKQDPSYKEKISKTSKGRKWSEESKLKKSKIQEGINNPYYIKFNDIDKQSIISFHVEDKKSMNEIGKIFKVAPQTIKRLLIESGINITKHINQHN